MPGHDEASETAQCIALLCPHLSTETLQQLRALLSHDVHAPSVPRRRAAALGLLSEIVCAGTGELPSRDSYMRLRHQRAGDGQHWPTDEQLIASYGSWLKVLRAVMLLRQRGGHARTKTRPAAAAYKQTFTQEEIIFALRRFHRRHQTWPTPWEFLEWGQLERRHARRHGLDDPRVPGMKQITGAFGDYDTAVEAARSWAP